MSETYKSADCRGSNGGIVFVLLENVVLSEIAELLFSLSSSEGCLHVVWNVDGDRHSA